VVVGFRAYDTPVLGGCVFGRWWSRATTLSGGGPTGTMISISGASGLHKIVVMNPKGGCGKTTLATNVAGWFALRGVTPMLLDFDPHGYCMRWLERRGANRPRVYGCAASLRGENTQPEVPRESSVLIVDLPAAITDSQLHDFVFFADSLLLPVTPSAIDVHSATRFVAELLLDAQLDRSERRLAIVANRVRERTKSFAKLVDFLASLRIPLIASLRDSQNFVHAAAQGLSVCELPPHRAREDLPGLDAVGQWLAQRRSLSLAQREAVIARAAQRYAEARGLAGATVGASSAGKEIGRSEEAS
jgi:chromosome partitioning protein